MRFECQLRHKWRLNIEVLPLARYVTMGIEHGYLCHHKQREFEDVGCLHMKELGLTENGWKLLGHPDERSHIQSLRNTRSCENVCDRVSFLNTSIRENVYVRTQVYVRSEERKKTKKQLNGTYKLRLPNVLFSQRHSIV